MTRRLVAAFLLALGFAPNIALEGQVAAASVADEWTVSSQSPAPAMPFDGVQKRLLDPGAGRSTGTPALAPAGLALITSTETRCELATSRRSSAICRPTAERLPYDANAPPRDSRAQSTL